MTVVINDFEVVTEPPAQNRQADGDNNGQSQAQPPTPQEIERVVQRQTERQARVWAH